MKAKTNPTKTTPNIQSVELKVYNRPSFTDTVFNGKRWIPRGKDNLFAIYLIDLYNQSNTHGAVVDGKISYMVGRGLYVETENQNLYDIAECQKFLEHPNPYETWDAIDKKIKTDFEIHNAFAFELLRNKFGKPVEVYHLSWDRLALDKVDTNLYLYSEDWETKYSTPEKRQQNQSPIIVEIPKFDPKQIQPRSVIVHQEPHPGMRFYTLPPYINGIEAIEEEIEISQFHLNNVMNGFVGGTLINFLNGIPSDTIQGQIEDKFNQKFTGGRGSKVLYNFADGKENAAEVLPLTPNTLDKQFEQRAKVVPENIIIAHRGVSGMLFGIKTEGQLGGRTEVLESYELFKETYIKPRQDTVLAVYNSIFKLFGCKPLIKTKELKPLANLLPLTEQTIANVIPREVIKDYLVELYGLTLPKPVAPVQLSDDFYFAKCGLNAADFEEIEAHDMEFSEETGVKFKYSDEGEGLYFADEDPQDAVTGGKTSAKTTKTSPILIKYKYALRSDAPALRGESRDFCQRMMSLNRLYTKKEIEGMRNDMESNDIINNKNVWLFRGGWYTNPNTDAATPFCRHIWSQVLVRQK